MVTKIALAGVSVLVMLAIEAATPAKAADLASPAVPYAAPHEDLLGGSGSIHLGFDGIRLNGGALVGPGHGSAGVGIGPRGIDLGSHVGVGEQPEVPVHPQPHAVPRPLPLPVKSTRVERAAKVPPHVGEK